MSIVYEYAISLAWAATVVLFIGLSIIVLFRCTGRALKRNDLGELVKEGNISVAIILAAVIITLGIVTVAAIQP